MKKILAGLVILLLVGGVAAYFYLRGSDKHLQLIPKDAFVVASVDFTSLAKKADYDKIKELSYMKDMKKSTEKSTDSTSQHVMEVLSNPLTCGINPMSDVYFFGAKEGAGYAGGMVFDIKDAGKFEASIKKISPTAEITSQSNYKMIYISGVALAWNSTGGIFGGTDKMTDKAAAIAFLDATFKRSRGESILSNDMFKKFDKGKKDISFFMNGSELMDVLKNMPSSASNPFGASAMSYLGDSYKGVYSWAYLNFGDDKISITSHIETPNGGDAKFEMLNKSGLSSEHMGLITSKNVYALASFNVNMEKVFAYYEAIPMIKTYEAQAATTMGMTEKDLKNLLGGEISIALVDVKKNDAAAAAPADSDENATDEDGMPVARKRRAPPITPVVVFNFSSNNKEGITKLLDQYLGGKNAKGYYSSPVPGGYLVNVAPNKVGFTITNDEEIASTIATKGTLGSLPANVSDLVKSNSSVMYVDLNTDNYPDVIKGMIADASHDKEVAAGMSYVKLFKDITMTGNPRDAELDLNFNKGTGNTLYRLFAQADEVYKVTKAPVSE